VCSSDLYRFPLGPRDQRLIDQCEVTATPSLTLPFDVEVETDLEEAEIIEDDDGSDQPGLGIKELAQALSEVRDQQEVLQILLRHLSQVFERAAIFLVRENEVSGWKAVCRQQEITSFEELNLPLESPSVLKTVVEGKSFYLGPISVNGLNQDLLNALGGDTPEAVLLMPLVLDGRVVNLFYGDGGSGQLVGQVGALQRLQEMAVLAFRILILKNRLLASG